MGNQNMRDANAELDSASWALQREIDAVEDTLATAERNGDEKPPDMVVALDMLKKALRMTNEAKYLAYLAKERLPNW